ncbi:hypothetical protein [Aquisphaera insulae]|uniref:hypothetical protein n=1 Tax=Aquisphaera insulae TaxID=2712864 RepID=UPI0013EA2232|nr:hypothetical protein [Aquisphaera insulae]
MLHGLADAASGMGDLARGTGSLLHDGAIAESIHADTAMRVNQYAWNCYLEQVRRRGDHLERRKLRCDRARALIEDRLLFHPEIRDIDSGDAPNALIRYLTGPEVSPSALRALALPLPRAVGDPMPLILNRAHNVIIAPGRLRVSHRWPGYLLDPSFARQRQAVERLVDDSLARAAGGMPLSAATTALDQAVASLRDQVGRSLSSGTARERDHAGSFLEGLAAASRMLREPDAVEIIRYVHGHPATTTADVVQLMSRFHLQLAPAVSPEEQDLYRELHLVLVNQRSRLLGDQARRSARPIRNLRMAEPAPRLAGR